MIQRCKWFVVVVVVCLLRDAPGRADAADRDDPQSLAALRQLGTGLKRDGEGYVVEVSFRGAAGAKCDDAALDHLLGLRRLKSALLNDTGISDTGLATLGKIATLQNLDLRGCKVSNIGMAHLTILSNLRALRLSGKTGATTVDDRALADLGKLTSLKALLLDFLWVSEEGLAQLNGLKNLEELYLARTLVGDEAMSVLQQFPKLRTLRISQTQVTGQGLAALPILKRLEDLDVSQCSRLADDSLAPLAAMTQLQRLNLWRVAITDDGVAHLANLTDMRWLNLDNTQITDAGLRHLQGMKKLAMLHLGSTAVSDAGLPQLAGLTALENLNVSRTSITADGVQQLKIKLPKTAVELKYIERP